MSVMMSLLLAVTYTPSIKPLDIIPVFKTRTEVHYKYSQIEEKMEEISSSAVLSEITKPAQEEISQAHDNSILAGPVAAQIDWSRGKKVGNVLIFPLSGDNIILGSNAAFFQDSSGQKVVRTTIAKEATDSAVDIDISENNRLVTSQRLVVDFDEGESILASNFKIVKCLTAAGYSIGTALVIISTCGALCAVTVGAGCVLCAAGFAAADGIVIGMCLSQK